MGAQVFYMKKCNITLYDEYDYVMSWCGIVLYKRSKHILHWATKLLSWRKSKGLKVDWTLSCLPLGNLVGVGATSSITQYSQWFFSWFLTDFSIFFAYFAQIKIKGYCTLSRSRGQRVEENRTTGISDPKPQNCSSTHLINSIKNYFRPTQSQHFFNQAL